MKAIYQPKNKAAEYAEWACNFYVGCSNNCSYCYLKKGIGCKTLGGNVPTLKKCFTSRENAIDIFLKEVNNNLTELKQHGLFFSFTTDPLLPKTYDLTFDALEICMLKNIGVKILTKRTDWIDRIDFDYLRGVEKKIAFGFTLTGHDELEPGASTNAERIEAMKKLHDAGFKTFASIEPIINFADSLDMIQRSYPFCDLYKIGLESGKKYPMDLLIGFFQQVLLEGDVPVYFKDTFLKAVGIDRSQLPASCVDRDFNIFQTTI